MLLLLSVAAANPGRFVVPVMMMVVAMAMTITTVTMVEMMNAAATTAGEFFL